MWRPNIRILACAALCLLGTAWGTGTEEENHSCGGGGGGGGGKPVSALLPDDNDACRLDWEKKDSSSLSEELRAWAKTAFAKEAAPRLTEAKSTTADAEKIEAAGFACYTEEDVEHVFSRTRRKTEDEIQEETPKEEGEEEEDIDNNSKAKEDRHYVKEELSRLDQLSGAGSIVFRNGSELRSDSFARGILSPGATATLYTSDGQSFLTGSASPAASGSTCLSGLVMGYESSFSSDSEPVFLAEFDPRTGLPVGPAWYRVLSVYEKALVGLLYFEADPAGVADVREELDNIRNHNFQHMFNGPEVAFIYPDFETVLLGRWDHGTMSEARQVRIESVSSSSRDGTSGLLRRLSFSAPSGPAFRSDVSNRTRLSSDPLLRDPYEEKLVEVRESSIEGAGQGVFLRRAVPAGTIVSYFNGVRVKESEVFDGSPNEEKSVYLVEIGEEDDYLDVPKDMASWDNYQASTGHKINHNSEAPGDYADCDHPRFGRIHCYVVKKDMEAGEELFTRYDVSFDQNQMKDILKAALNVGHFFSGKSKKEFVREVRPLLEAASKVVGSIKIDNFLSFGKPTQPLWGKP